jgi:hypothetical protein
MKILRYTLLAALFIAGQPLAAIKTPQEAFSTPACVADMQAWTETALAKFKTLNGGEEFALNTGLVKFIREHAHEIAQELAYLIDHPNKQVEMLTKYEVEKFLTSVERFFKNAHLSTEQTVETLLQQPQTITLLADALAFWNALKNLTIQSIPQDYCPLLHQGITQLSTIESLYAGLLPIMQKHALEITVPAVAAEKLEEIQKNCVTLKHMHTASAEYAQSDENKQLTKNLLHAWATFMKEDTFFDTLQSNGECTRNGNFAEQKPLVMPESLTKFLAAAEAAGRGYQHALEPFADELKTVFPLVTIEYVDECDFDDACCDDDCCEYDFNAEFKKRHTSK